MVSRQNAYIINTLQLREVAMATTFWLPMGYNFACVIANDTAFDFRCEFAGSSYPMKTVGSHGRCRSNHLWDCITCK